MKTYQSQPKAWEMASAVNDFVDYNILYLIAMCATGMFQANSVSSEKLGEVSCLLCQEVRHFSSFLTEIYFVCSIFMHINQCGQSLIIGKWYLPLHKSMHLRKVCAGIQGKNSMSKNGVAMEGIFMTW